MLRLARTTPATTAVLRVLLEAGVEPVWGLRIVAETWRPAGSVYPILARLEAGGWVASQWEESAVRGPRRRLYAFTAEGRSSAVAVVDAAARAAHDVSTVLRPRLEGA